MYTIKSTGLRTEYCQTPFIIIRKLDLTPSVVSHTHTRVTCSFLGNGHQAINLSDTTNCIGNSFRYPLCYSPQQTLVVVLMFFICHTPDRYIEMCSFTGSAIMCALQSQCIVIQKYNHIWGKYKLKSVLTFYKIKNIIIWRTLRNGWSLSI